MADTPEIAGQTIADAAMMAARHNNPGAREADLRIAARDYLMKAMWHLRPAISLAFREGDDVAPKRQREHDAFSQEENGTWWGKP